MRSEPFDLQGADGRRLGALLDLPDGPPIACALFAHCFTCDKTSKAAVRIGYALAEKGVAVLRLDFTGLGDSDGEVTGLSGNAGDLIRAAEQMQAKGLAPSLLIGHSLGGAAVLAAAGEIASAKAVAVIGAPSDPAHVLKLLGAGLAAIEAKGRAEVSIAGRTFVLDRAFVDDMRTQDLKARIGDLRRALLILHSPVDAIVGVENATAIFLAARHPKSFVSLDQADHLLTRIADAEYAGAVIAAWSGRYLGAAPVTDAPAAPAGAVLVEETGAGKFQAQVTIGQTRFLVDEPAEVGGLGSGAAPYDLLSAGLGACTAMTLRLYADRKGWPLKRTRVTVSHDKDAQQTPADHFERRIALEGPLSQEQRARLFEMADRCPVHLTLERGSRISAAAAEAAVPAGDPCQHFENMDQACKAAGASA